MTAKIIKKLNTFFDDFDLKKIKNGAILIQKDEDPVGIFYLRKGRVREYFISPKGDEITLNIFKPESFFPMSWAINTTKNNYYFEAMTDISVNIAPKESVLTFVKNNPDVLYDLLSRVYKGTDGIFVKMINLMSGDAKERLLTELLIQAQRFGKNTNGQLKIDISEKDLASLTGLQRETVSRKMKAFKSNHLLELKRHSLSINKLNLLQEELS